MKKLLIATAVSAVLSSSAMASTNDFVSSSDFQVSVNANKVAFSHIVDNTDSIKKLHDQTDAALKQTQHIALSANQNTVNNADLISSNTNDVKQVAAITTANADLIAFEQNDIAANTRHEKSTEQRAIKNSQTFALYDKKISSNRDAVDKNTNDIKDLRSDFKEMGKRVDGTAAMGMATSSLFQPYGIGKANVTVGLGNYNGANAVAFGSGIRIDEHVALRANVAYVDSTNDTGFGVGASYEW